MPTTPKDGENERTVVPLKSTREAVGDPMAMASLTLLTPAVMGNVPEEEPMERWRVYEPVENTTQ